MEFFPAPFKPPKEPFAVLVFIWQNDKVLLARIRDRGWCIPSGRIEPGETPTQAAIRESVEEVAADISNPIPIGYFKITKNDVVKWAIAFTSSVVSLNDFIPTPESANRKSFMLSQLPEIYYLWNPLTEAVFQCARTVVQEKS